MLNRTFGLRILALTALAAQVLLLPVQPAVADNAAAFQKTLRTQNAKHLERVIPPLAESGGIMIDASYSEDGQKGPWGLRVGDLEISVEMKRTAPIDLAQFPVPVVKVSLAGETVITAEGPQGQPEFAAFVVQVAEMDPDNPHPEIVFSSYTGGAHCCSDTRILTSSKAGGKWREVDAGLFDGGPVPARDIDGDGRYEIVTRDNRFLYRFGCYACSAAPLLMLQLVDGKLADVSDKKTYRDEHERSLVRMVQYYEGGSEEANGFLAGYVAQKIRLGEGKEAWDFMLKFHDTNTDWGLDECTVPLNDKNECPGKTIRHTFPEALKRFFVESGYPVPE